LREDEAKLALSNSRNAPDTGAALAKIRQACGDSFLVGEVYLPSARWQPYSDYFDAVFAFELLHSPWDDRLLRAAIEACVRQPRAAWVMSNHDFGRLSTRFGDENARAAAMLLLALPGPAFLYQGDEIGQGEGPPGEARFDRAGRDRHRHPMQWDASPQGGFTTGQPWLPLVDPAARNVADQRDDPASVLSLVRELIGFRRELGDGFELLDAADGLLAFRRGDHTVAINTTGEPLPAPLRRAPRIQTHAGALRDGELAPHAGAIALD
jgi:alpha-glucosidase